MPEASPSALFIRMLTNSRIQFRCNHAAEGESSTWAIRSGEIPLRDLAAATGGDSDSLSSVLAGIVLAFGGPPCCPAAAASDLAGTQTIGKEPERPETRGLHATSGPAACFAPERPGVTQAGRMARIAL
jgi:hypothetical protein